MTTLYLVIEMVALLGIIIFPLYGPKKNKIKKRAEQLSNLYVNENGYLEYNIKDDKDHHLPVY